MQCLPEFGRPFIIDSLSAPIVFKHYWIYNAQQCDFMFAPLNYLEETTGAAVKLRINNFEFFVPATWNILVTDRETYQIDTVNVTDCASKRHLAYIFSPSDMNLRTAQVDIVDTAQEISLVHPMINKGTALVHPIGPTYRLGSDPIELAVVLGPFDLHKYIDGKVVGDLIN